MQGLRLYALFALVCGVWGLTWVALKIDLVVVPPFLLGGTRFVAAGLTLMVLLMARRGLPRIARTDLPRLLAVTLLMNAATYGLVFWGAVYVPSGLTSILNLAFTPMALLGFGALAGVDRITPWKVAGMAVGVAGLGILFGPQAMAGAAAGTPHEVQGAAALVTSSLVYALGSVLARPLLRRYGAMEISACSMLGGGLALLALGVGLNPAAATHLFAGWSATVWGCWLFLTVFGSVIASTAFLRLIHEWGGARAGSYCFVSPIIAVLAGVMVLHEQVSVMEALGMAVMLGGAYLVVRP